MNNTKVPEWKIVICGLRDIWNRYKLSNFPLLIYN